MAKRLRGLGGFGRKVKRLGRMVEKREKNNKKTEGLLVVRGKKGEIESGRLECRTKETVGGGWL